MESKDDIKNTEKYLDDILLYKALIDQECSSDEEVQKAPKRKIPQSVTSPQKQAQKTLKEILVNPSPGDSLSPQEMEPLLSFHHPEKDSHSQRNLQPSESMCLSMSQNLQSVSPWWWSPHPLPLSEPEVDQN